MSFDPLFRGTVEQLITGVIICPVTEPEKFDYLADSVSIDKVQHYLAQIGRGLSCTRDGNGYYAVALDLDDKGTRARIRNEFERITGQWEPLIRWLRMSQQVATDKHPIAFNDTVSEGDWLKAIEASSALQEELEIICLKMQIKKAQDARQRLRALFEKLQKDGFLKSKGPSGALFQATARWSLLKDQMEFVTQQEGIIAANNARAAEDHQEQEALFHGRSE